MEIVSWNINGLRTTRVEETQRSSLKVLLDSLRADVICLQETKLSRDLLDEPTAIIEGYNAYFSISRTRNGYSGVVTYCKNSATPIAAEEGLSGLLVGHGRSVGCYGDTSDFSTNELQALDAEGRAVITQHHVVFAGSDHAEVVAEGGAETLSIVNVYCPRADPERPDRAAFKLRFYKLLQLRVEAILSSGSHVVLLGDVNTAHRLIDHCDPDNPLTFDEHPGRRWLDHFLCINTHEEVVAPFAAGNDRESCNTDSKMHRNSSNLCGHIEDVSKISAVEESELCFDDKSENDCCGTKSGSGGHFVDAFRLLHPSREGAYTCWSVATGARATNYGTRIDYVFLDRHLAQRGLVACTIDSDVYGSDHCPVRATLRYTLVPACHVPPLCASLMPEFSGRQQKIGAYLLSKPCSRLSTVSSRGVNVSEQVEVHSASHSALSKRAPECRRDRGAKRARGRNGIDVPTRQHDVRRFFSAKSKGEDEIEKCHRSQRDGILKTCEQYAVENTMLQTEAEIKVQNNEGFEPKSLDPLLDSNSVSSDRQCSQEVSIGSKIDGCCASQSEKNGGAAFWKTLLAGPPPPPLCPGHGEAAVLRIVKKSGPNQGRRFYVCARPAGHSDNPAARCDFFQWTKR
uniref:DNA-(apurinic or apyrimidinic site) endonuclease 2 n=1 Tax=Myxine glutinosa TaxID=7769 RepID=UPI00358E873A